jgi:hypothetical protein
VACAPWGGVSPQAGHQHDRGRGRPPRGRDHHHRGHLRRRLQQCDRRGLLRPLGPHRHRGPLARSGADDVRKVDETPLTRSEPPRRRTVRRARLLVAAPLAAVALASAAAIPAQADGPWWQIAAFPGQTVSRVAVVQGRVTALVGGVAMVQTASGFVAAAAPPPPAPRGSPPARTPGPSVPRVR